MLYYIFLWDYNFWIFLCTYFYLLRRKFYLEIFPVSIITFANIYKHLPLSFRSLARNPSSHAKSAIPGSRPTPAINLSITGYVRRNGQVVSCVTSLKSGAAKRSKTVANLRVKPRLMRDNFEARKPLKKINDPEFPFWYRLSFARL